MNGVGFAVVACSLLMVGCGSQELSAVKSVVETQDSIRIQYDPTRIINAEMREIARLQCSDRGLILTDVTVSPTASPTVSFANVFCG